jgi:uncharacterized membrane protein YgcG
MMKRILLLIVSLLAGLSPQARAATPGVYDAAGFFSADAVTQANQVISDIKQSTKHDLMIETYSSIPADMQSAYDPAKKNDFFEKWLVSRARVLQVRGVFVLICKDPSRIQLDVGSETRAKAFTIANRDALRDILVSQFKAKNYDQGLLDGVNYVQSTMQANLANSSAQSNSANGGAVSQYPVNQYPNSVPMGSGPTRTSTNHFGFVTVIIVIGVLFFILRFIFRAIFRSQGSSYGAYGSGYGSTNPPPMPPGNFGGYGYPPQSGGFGRGLLGGLLGGALGGYLYDRTTNRDQGGGSFPSGGGGGFPESPAAPSDQGDFNSSMFDSGNQGAGGDFGGGGDVGGGGGGGGDSGGGSGGDF